MTVNNKIPDYIDEVLTCNHSPHFFSNFARLNNMDARCAIVGQKLNLMKKSLCSDTFGNTSKTLFLNVFWLYRLVTDNDKNKNFH